MVPFNIWHFSFEFGVVHSPGWARVGLYTGSSLWLCWSGGSAPQPRSIDIFLSLIFTSYCVPSVDDVAVFLGEICNWQMKCTALYVQLHSLVVGREAVISTGIEEWRPRWEEIQFNVVGRGEELSKCAPGQILEYEMFMSKRFYIFAVFLECEFCWRVSPTISWR